MNQVPDVPEDIVYQIGMWQVSAREKQTVKVLHWTNDTVITMNSPWYDMVKFSAALLMQSELSLIKDGISHEEARKMTFSEFWAQCDKVIESVKADYERQTRAAR